MIMFHGLGWGKVLTSAGWVFVFVLGIRRISNWIYAYILVGSYFFKNQDPPPICHFQKINTCPIS